MAAGKPGHLQRAAYIGVIIFPRIMPRRCVHRGEIGNPGNRPIKTQLGEVPHIPRQVTHSGHRVSRRTNIHADQWAIPATGQPLQKMAADEAGTAKNNCSSGARRGIWQDWFHHVFSTIVCKLILKFSPKLPRATNRRARWARRPKHLLPNHFSHPRWLEQSASDDPLLLFTG